MDDQRERAPASPPTDQGGMTGATGNLTPDGPDEEFMPAETREMSDPAAARQLTASAHRRAEAHRAEETDDPTGPLVEDAAKPQAGRAGGYGSGKGLAADDPAYRTEERGLPQAGPPGAGPLPTGGGTILGGDERREPEDEHL
jgi:hypothetical protein